MRNNYKVIYYYSAEDNNYLAFAPELQGCFADGKTVSQAIENLDIIIDEWIETANEIGRKLPKVLPEDLKTSSTDIFSTAKYILEKTGKISTMTLEKLTYYCLVWSLVWYDKPLFSNKFQAWRRGPVCKELFEIHRGKRVISADMINSSTELASDEKALVDCVLSVYGHENGEFLSELTHNEKPWKKTRGELPDDANSDKIITDDLIKEAYCY